MSARIKIGQPTLVFSDPGFDFNMCSLCCLADGGMLCVARKIKSLSDPRGEFVMARSADGGASFTPVPPPSAADMRDHPEWGYLLGFVCETSPGKLASHYSVIETDDAQPLFHPETDGMQPAFVRCTVSDDGGATWSQPRDIGYKLPDIIVPGQSYVLPDGSLGFTTEIHHVWDKGFAEGPSARLIVSRDGGRTYDEGYVMAAKDGFIHGDARVTFAGGDMIVYYWIYDVKNNRDLPVHRSVSRDSGRTWSAPAPLGLNMQITSPFYVRPGLTMCLTQDRFGDVPGIKALLSYDEGQTWDMTSAAMLYGAQTRPDGNNPFAQFDQYKFGYSSLRRISENEAMAVYWHELDGRKAVSVNKITIE